MHYSVHRTLFGADLGGIRTNLSDPANQYDQRSQPNELLDIIGRRCPSQYHHRRRCAWANQKETSHALRHVAPRCAPRFGRMRPSASPGWLSGDCDVDLTRTGWQTLPCGDHDLCRPTTNGHNRGVTADGHHDDVCHTYASDRQVRDAGYRTDDRFVATVEGQPACARGWEQPRCGRFAIRLDVDHHASRNTLTIVGSHNRRRCATTKASYACDSSALFALAVKWMIADEG
jgi:hypothetical protein